MDEPGFYAPGFSGVQGGPTLAWADAETDAKLAGFVPGLAAPERTCGAYSIAAEPDALKTVEQMLAGAPAALASHVQQSLTRDLAAYYAFDQTEPLDEAKIPAAPPAEQLPAELAVIRGPQQRSGFGGPPPQAPAANGARGNAARGRGQGPGGGNAGGGGN